MAGYPAGLPGNFAGYAASWDWIDRKERKGYEIFY